MAYYMATIQVLVDVEDSGEACDAIAEGIRPMLREFGAKDSAWIDWRYDPKHMLPAPHSGAGFEYADTTGTGYAGYIRALTGTALGGVRASRSIEFKTRKEATDWMLQAVETNRAAGREVVGEVFTLWQGKIVEVR